MSCYREHIDFLPHTVNFEGYVDKTHTARMQAKYTDIVLLNKHELVTREQLDRVQDDVCDLNPETPIIRTNKGMVNPEVVFGLDSKIFTAISSDNQTNLSQHEAFGYATSLKPSQGGANTSDVGDVDVAHIEWYDQISQSQSPAISFAELRGFLESLHQNTSCTFGEIAI